jgi:hypothetical protein
MLVVNKIIQILEEVIHKRVDPYVSLQSGETNLSSAMYCRTIEGYLILLYAFSITSRSSHSAAIFVLVCNSLVACHAQAKATQYRIIAWYAYWKFSWVVA